MTRTPTQKQWELVQHAGACYAAANLLLTLAMDYIDSGDMAVNKAKYDCHEIKSTAKGVQRHFDLYCKTFSKYIGKDDSRLILRDYEELKPKIEEILEVKL